RRCWAWARTCHQAPILRWTGSIYRIAATSWRRPQTCSLICGRSIAPAQPQSPSCQCRTMVLARRLTTGWLTQRHRAVRNPVEPLDPVTSRRRSRDTQTEPPVGGRIASEVVNEIVAPRSDADLLARFAGIVGTPYAITDPVA